MRKSNSRSGGLVFLFALALYLLSPCLLLAQAKPRITLPESSYDFGTVVEGAKVQHEFVIKNQGDADLTIQRVLTGCGCTATNASASTLKPGEEGKISVTFDSSGLPGVQDKGVRIYSNDPENGIAVISLKGRVESEIEIQPENVMFEGLLHGQSTVQKQEVRVKVRNAGVIKLGDVNAYSKYLKIESVDGDENSKNIVVSLDPTLPIGELRDRIIVDLKGAGRKSISIPVFASVRGALKISPPAVSFGVLLGSQPLRRQVKISNFSAANFKILDAVAEDPAVSVNYKLADDGKAYIVDIQVDPGKITRDLRTSVKLTSEGVDGQELITLNVYGVLPPKL